MLSLYPQNGDRIVTTDSVTSFHPMYMQRLTKNPDGTCRSVISRSQRNTAAETHAGAGFRSTDASLLLRSWCCSRTDRQTDGQTDGQTPDRCFTLRTHSQRNQDSGTTKQLMWFELQWTTK